MIDIAAVKTRKIMIHGVGALLMMLFVTYQWTKKLKLTRPTLKFTAYIQPAKINLEIEDENMEIQVQQQHSKGKWKHADTVHTKKRNIWEQE